MTVDSSSLPKAKLPRFIAWIFSGRILRSYYYYLGAGVAYWGSLEFIVDCIISRFFRHLDGAEIEPEVPRSFGRKLTYLQKAFASRPLGEDLSMKAATLIEQSKALSERRQLLVHSITLDLLPAEFTAKLRKFTYKKDHHLWDTHHIHVRDVRQFMIDTSKLTISWLDFLEEVESAIRARA